MVGLETVCVCQTGWTGYFCEIDYDECSSQPCFENASCMDFLDEYVCYAALKYWIFGKNFKELFEKLFQNCSLIARQGSLVSTVASQ